MNKSTVRAISFNEIFPLISEEINAGRDFSFTAFGRSMLPFIQDGKDKLTLSPIRSPIKKHDIVFYRRDNGTFVLHRIVSLHPNDLFDLCGDNQYLIEKGIRADQIFARLSVLKRNDISFSFSSSRYRIYLFFLPTRRFFIHVRLWLKCRLKFGTLRK